MNGFSLPRKTLERTCNIKSVDFDMMLHTNPECRGTEDGYPVFEVCKYFVEKAAETSKKLLEIEKTLEKAQQRLSEYGEGDLEAPTESNLREIEKEILDNELKKHRIMKDRVVIETQLGVLIPKDIAETRTKKLLNKIAEQMDTNINHSAEAIVEMENPRDYRSVRIVLTGKYNKTIKGIFDSADNVSWSEDGSSEDLQQRLKAVKFNDPEFERVYNTLYKNESV